MCIYCRYFSLGLFLRNFVNRFHTDISYNRTKNRHYNFWIRNSNLETRIWIIYFMQGDTYEIYRLGLNAHLVKVTDWIKHLKSDQNFVSHFLLLTANTLTHSCLSLISLCKNTSSNGTSIFTKRD